MARKPLVLSSHTVLCCLLARKYRVCTIDNFHNSFPEACKRVSQLSLDALDANASAEDREDAQVRVFRGDLTSPADIEQVFAAYADDGGVFAVIQIAAHKAVGESGEKPIQYYNNNIAAIVHLLDAMQRHGCGRIIFSSSATVYGAPTTIPIPESTPLDPQSVYGRTKAMAEHILKDVCDSAPTKWRCISLRYFNPAGAHPSGRIGESPVGRPGNLLPLLSAIAAGRYSRDPLRVFGNDYPTPDGTCVRDYIHVMDLAQGHIVALDALERDETFARKEQSSAFGGSGGLFKAYNLGKGKGMSVLSMIEAMRKATGYDFKYEIVGRRVGDVPDLTAAPELAERELGFQAPRTLDEMCRDLWNWQQANPYGYDTEHAS